MELSNLYLQLVVAPIIIFFFFVLLKTLNNHHKPNTPPSPPSLPILGHLHLLLSIKSPIHQHLQSLSAKYGDVLLFGLGTRHVLLLSSVKEVEHYLAQNDVVFANRPESIPFNIIGYSASTLIAAPYGDHWRNLRRITTINLFSAVCIRRSATVRNTQCWEWIRCCEDEAGIAAEDDPRRLLNLCPRRLKNIG